MGTGGARYGAGRPAYRMMAEQSMRVDIRLWARGSYLRAGNWFSWAWHRGEERTGSINVEVTNPAELTLKYWIGSGDERRDASQRIYLAVSPCHFGGVRRWFTCPVCGRRAGLLYLRSGRFACRPCQRVSYLCQSGGPIDRLSCRIQKLEARIEGGKPKGMRRATYERLCERIDSLNEAYESHLDARLYTMFGRCLGGNFLRREAS